MFIAIRRVKNISSFEKMDCYITIFLCVHLDLSIQNDKDLRPIIYMPLIGLVCPMKTNGRCARYAFNVHSFPGTGSVEMVR